MKKIFCFFAKIFATSLLLIFGSLFFIIMSVMALIALLIPYTGAIWLVSRVWGRGMLLLAGTFPIVHGRHFIEKNKAYILVGNHASNLDIPAVYLVTTGPVAWFAKSSLFNIPLVGWTLRAIGAIPIVRKNARKTQANIQSKIPYYKHNRWIVMFPEGTRTKDGQIHSFKKGFVRVMRQTGLDVLPVTINGMYGLFPRGVHLINPCAGPFELIVHEALKNEDWKDKSDSEIIERVSEIIKKDYRIPVTQKTGKK